MLVGCYLKFARKLVCIYDLPKVVSYGSARWVIQRSGGQRWRYVGRSNSGISLFVLSAAAFELAVSAANTEKEQSVTTSTTEAASNC
jgi:hypothetical protein